MCIRDSHEQELHDVGPDPVPVVLVTEPEGQSVPELEPERQDVPARVDTEGPPALPPRTLPVVPVPSSGRGAVSRIISNSGGKPKTIVDTGTRPKVPPKIVVSKGGARVVVQEEGTRPKDKDKHKTTQSKTAPGRTMRTRQEGTVSDVEWVSRNIPGLSLIHI